MQRVKTIRKEKREEENVSYFFFHKAAKLQANDCVFLQSYILVEQCTNAVQTYEKKGFIDLCSQRDQHTLSKKWSKHRQQCKLLTHRGTQVQNAQVY